MKIRNGFVSNSSSASYIIKIHGIEYDDFINTLVNEYQWSWFNKSELKKTLIERLTDNNQYVKEATRSLTKGYWFNTLQERIKEDSELLEKIKNVIDDKEIAEIVLYRNNIKITTDNDDVKIKSWTAMHNDYNDGMSKLLREITLYFMFETTHKVECSVKHDG